MKDEIKEILDKLKDKNNYISHSMILLSIKETHLLLDYITNLQEEVEDLREDNYAYHQLMKTQNAREYRSKFLKDFQEEFGTNTFPDYDEIYKRYDKIKKENEKLKEQLKYNDLIFKALYKSFSNHEEYENYELLKELETCYENKDIIWLQKFAGEDKQ